MPRTPGLEALKPFANASTLRVLLRPGGVQYAQQTWKLLAGAEAPPVTEGVETVVRRINTLCRRFDRPRYLEVGLFNGSTFLNVDAFVKVGVDPKPRFSSPALPSEGHTVFRGTSDQYFAASKGEEFDVVFLDGLHTFEQTWWDFLNSLSFCHERTVWIIDDVVPGDRFAAMPDEAAAQRAAEAAGGTVNGWQGDVFKIVLAIARTFPELAFATIINSGKEQLLVWLPDGTAVPRVLPEFWRLSVAEQFEDLFGDEGIPASFDPRPEGEALQAAIDGVRCRAS